MPFSPDQTRQERFASYAALLKERFNSGILSELQALPQWVVWRGELSEGKLKKAPYNPNVRNAYASVKARNSWGTLHNALAALSTGFYSGIGFVITPPLVLIDLDHSVSKETGEIDPLAEEIVEIIGSYTEKSPSKKGLHILAYGQLPGKNIHTDIEMYGQDRFTTITTDQLYDTLARIEPRQEEITLLYKQFAPPLPTPIIQNTRGGVERSTPLSALPPEATNDLLRAFPNSKK